MASAVLVISTLLWYLNWSTEIRKTKEELLKSHVNREAEENFKNFSVSVSSRQLPFSVFLISGEVQLFLPQTKLLHDQ